MSAELEPVGGELEVRAVSPTLFRTDDPAEVLARAVETAKPLAQAVRDRGLAVEIQGREHVKVEGWTLLGAMLGVFPVCVWTRKLEDGWEARVEARTRDGATVGAAEAQCTRGENQWSFEPVGRDGKKLQPRDDFALRSMAQTRATAKALRQPLGFVMQLAGFNPTPAEEMTGTGEQGTVAASEKQRRYLTQLAERAGVPYQPPAGLSKQEASRLIEAVKAGDMTVLAVPDVVCGECGLPDGDHAAGCSEAIPF